MPARTGVWRRCSALAAAGLGLAASSALAQAPAEAMLEPVEVQGSADAQRRFDAAASHSIVTVDGFQAISPLVHLSELLAAQPGVMALDRGNYAQDLQIAIRGFGTRSTFGVRGVRILVDGIPATMPDGQGQAATAQLSSASRVEVLRGPLAQQYGNAAGGVLQVTTREPRAGGALQAGIAAGSYGQRQAQASVDFGSHALSGLVDVARYETDGWREHSAAQRTHLNAKLVARPGAATKLTALVNLYDQPRAQDPLGLTRAQWLDDPRQAPGIAATFDTRKSVAQNQLGVVLEHALSDSDSLRARAYAGQRDMRQFLSFSGDAASSAGGVVDLDRTYYGIGLAWTRTVRRASGLPLTWTVGLDADRLSEQRQGFVNAQGSAGGLRRDERDRAGNTDLFVQLDAWLSPTWRAIAGLRSSRVRADVSDRFVTPANPDDSGQRRWQQTSPVLGLVWAVNDQLNVYGNLGKGFETPTLAEMAYSPGNAGPNYALGASRSRQWELGAKWRSGAQTVEAAWFDARSRDEIVPSATVNGRTVYQNVSNVRRRGLELAWSAQARAWSSRLAYTYLDAFFGDGYVGANGAPVAAGNRLPGTARQSAQWLVTYAPNARWEVGGSIDASGTVFANDANSEQAPGYAVVGLRAGYTWGSAQSTRWRLWARLDNLLDRRYVGSLIVNDGNGRFFEPAPGRRIMVGLRGEFL